ncbi:hypothetical protein [Erwinia amylovora]|uniref:hypothetical protein n=1 Tax=Erwinia amylovora TaxID=552 RepID=UPI001443BF22|nr:hypothetical protein [Erwinia amylovora]
MFRFTQLVQNLITSGNAQAVERIEGIDGQAAKELTSIRLRPDTKAYLQSQSEALGVSLSQVINMILDGVVSMETKSSADNRVKKLYDRIMSLFESHHINPVEMVKMLSDYKIKLSHIRSPEIFVDHITTDMIKDIAAWFSVDYNWITGDSNYIYDPRSNSWYKDSYNFCVDLLGKSYSLSNFKIYVVVKKGVSFHLAEEYGDNDSRLDVGFILSYTNHVNGVCFTKYEVCEFQRWNYYKCRSYLRFIFYFLNKLYSKVMSYSISFDEKVINGLKGGVVLPSTIVKLTSDTWNFAEYIGNIKHNLNIETNAEEYLERFDRLIHLVGGVIHNFKYISKDFSHGWEIKYFDEGRIKEGFYSDLTSGINEIYSNYTTGKFSP